jgi:hypothetical protein
LIAHDVEALPEKKNPAVARELIEALIAYDVEALPEKSKEIRIIGKFIKALGMKHKLRELGYEDTLPGEAENYILTQHIRH